MGRSNGNGHASRAHGAGQSARCRTRRDRKERADLLRIGIIGLDTSHSVAFTELLNREEHPHHVPGGRVTVAYPGGSPDFPLSIGRVEGFTKRMKEEFGVEIVDSPEAVAAKCDALLLESSDGRVHAEQFAAIAPYGKPVFVDKPLAVTSADARLIAELAERNGIPVMSSSALRYAVPLVQALAAEESPVSGIDAYGPMDIEPTQGGLFWYGIHTVEMVYAALGPGCVEVIARANESHDVVTGVWADGRIATIRGNRIGNYRFGAILHRASGSQPVDVSATPKPYYASLLEQVIGMFRTGAAPLAMAETLEVIRFVEAANESRETGRPVRL
ncbi:gfo/Idh/MocA family oxidoreductase [Paenibacillus thermoaerophilus]|nr:gfo/Idh/MocA family oxidoreductase [Paenibacillus thermoaerophilus]